MATTVTPRLGLKKQASGDNTGAWEVDMNAGYDDADARFFKSGAVSPDLVETADYIGQRYYDTVLQHWWTAIDVAGPSNWILEDGFSGVLADKDGVNTDAVIANLKNYYAQDLGGTSRRVAQVNVANRLFLGDQALTGGMSLEVDGIDELVVNYGAGDQKVFHAGHTGILAEFFEETGISIGAPTPSTGSFAHGMSSLAKLYQAVLVNINAVNGYALGEEAAIINPINDASLITSSDAVNLSYAYAGISGPRYVRKDTQAIGTASSANWTITIRCWT